MKTTLTILLSVIVISSCVEVLKPFNVLPPGIWRGEITLQKGIILPFNFSVEEREGVIQLYIHNDTERILADEITFGRNTLYKDTITINFALMDSYIEALYKENVIEGSWVVRNRENYALPFVGYHGRDYRFSTQNVPPKTDLTGSWKTIFEVETPGAYPAVGEFRQVGNKLTGTFRTETGDYRYLDGEVQGDKLMLSAFDGSHAFLFEGTIVNDEQITGKFYSGNHYETNWVATKDADYDIADPFDVNSITTPDKKISFRFENTEGEMVSLDDPAYQNKGKLISIFGTWCPNCLDESRYILDYLKSNPLLDVEVIGIAFERHKNELDAKNAIINYKQRLDIPYELLFGGYEDKQSAGKVLGFMDKITAFPTLLFVNKHNEVVKVHTGFNGSATSKFAEFEEEFDATVRRIAQ